MRRLVLILFITAFLTLTAASGHSQEALSGPHARPAEPPQQTEGGAVPGELIVRYAPGVSPAARTAATSRAGASTVRQLALSRTSLVRVPPGEESAVAEELRAQPEVLSAEPNALRYASFIPNDPIFELQWHLQQIGMPDAWDLSTGAGVKVAVLDTGVAFENCNVPTCGANYTQAPDFAGTEFIDPYDAVGEDAHPNDVNGHGTFVASTIAQATNNMLGNAGIAYNASIMPVKVLGNNGMGNVADLIDAIAWAKNHGADVINLSLGAQGTLLVEQDAVDDAVAAGVVVIAAAGNSNSGVLECPACYPSSIAVGATRFDETRSYYSNYGTGAEGHTLDLVAPGGDVTVDQNNDTYGDGTIAQSFLHFCTPSGVNPNAYAICLAQGTSMATPHVVGVAALMLSLTPAMSPEQVRTVLQGTAVDRGPPGYDLAYGHGRLNAAAAVDAAETALNDSDEDGCLDWQEAGPEPVLGGRRDDDFFWDFFDTPDELNVRDKAVAGSDLFRIMGRFSTAGDPGIDPLSPPPTDGYHPAFDRGPSTGPNPWNLQPANGSISGSDIFASLAQFGHSCL